MSNTFTEHSKSIANDFLQSIVFIDDRAYASPGDDGNESSNNEFDALGITQAFAKSQKICAVYRPSTVKDIDDLAVLVKKADITVIDWQINIIKEVSAENKEVDAEEDDPRGPYTRKIIREILADSITGHGSLKLILVYTGEIDLPEITTEIFEDLKKQNIVGLQIGECKIFTENIKILVIAKPSGNPDEKAGKFKHNPDLNKKIVEIEDLPTFVLNEFSEMTSGLLSNFVLHSLSVLRNNTMRLLKIYNKELDIAFIHHRLLLPNQEESSEHLTELLAHSFLGLLNYNKAGECVSLEHVKSWIDNNTFSIAAKVSNKDFTIDNTFLKDWCSNGFTSVLSAYWAEKGYGDLGTNPVNNFLDTFNKNGSSFFQGGSIKKDSEFSILTHHKSNLKQPANAPKLTLGAIIKQVEGSYFLCIQAKCDSTRVKETRKFIFLPLQIVTDQKFQLVVEEGDSYVRLKIPKDAFQIRTIKFQPTAGNDSIIADLDNGKYQFTSTHNEKLEWVCDLKDAHAQRIAVAYAHQLSRIGLNESEWLRKWAGN